MYIYIYIYICSRYSLGRPQAHADAVRAALPADDAGRLRPISLLRLSLLRFVDYLLTQNVWEIPVRIQKINWKSVLKRQ